MTPAPFDWGGQRDRPNRIGMFFVSIWTLFLVEPLLEGWRHRAEPRGWLGIACTLAFAAFYLYVFLRRRFQIRAGDSGPSQLGAQTQLGVAVVLALLMCLTVGQIGTTATVYLCVLSVILLPSWYGPAGAAVVTVCAFVAGILVPGWESDAGLVLGCAAATLAIWGVQQVILRNSQLVTAADENARLAAEEERNRVARDLHDILGHSLTVITVKAELARRLFDADPERARHEVEDLERLSRDALTDVRRAVEGFRELTLPGEIARARSALRTADIRAELPGSVDEVPSELRELFAWTVREGVTNVIRHSAATRCVIRLTPASVEVADNGRGVSDATEHARGLIGLRQRADAVDATVVTRNLDPGFSLEVRCR